MTRMRTHAHSGLPRRLHRAPVLLATGLAPLLGGCLNESTTLVGAGPAPLPALAPAEPTAANPAPVTTSTTTLDRSHWPAHMLAQPRRQVAWSFFGTANPEWAVAHGPGALPPNAPPTFTP